MMKSRLFTLHTALLAVLVFVIFFIPLLDVSSHNIAYNFGFTLLLVISAFALRTKRRLLIVSVALGVVILQYVAFFLDNNVLFEISQSAKAIYFVIIVVGLVQQTARAKQVTLQVIVHSLSGYLLLGMVFAIGTIMITQGNAGAYNFSGAEPHSVPLFSDCMYYTFITFTTTGYGDLLPILPVARSFSIWIAACGQLYIAVIIALLVGKYSGASAEND
jgi:hypothetical protein